MPEDWFQCVAPAALLLSKMPASAWSCSHNHIASCAIEHYFFGISWNFSEFAVHRLAVLDQFLKTATHVGILSAMNFGRSHNNFEGPPELGVQRAPRCWRSLWRNAGG